MKLLSSGIIQITITLLLFVVTTGCSLTRIIPPEATLENIDVWIDANSVMQGLCFESAFDAAGRVFVLKNEGELSNFFDLADNSHLCRHPVARQSFDFSTGRTLVGLWSKGRGCKARHDITGIEKDDAAKTFTMRLLFVTEGTCNYELVRPFWVGVYGVSDYEISLILE